MDVGVYFATSCISYFGVWPLYISCVISYITSTYFNSPVGKVWSYILMHALISLNLGHNDLIRFFIMHFVCLIGTVGSYVVKATQKKVWAILWWAIVGGIAYTPNIIGNLFFIRSMSRFAVFYAANVATSKCKASSEIDILRWSWIFFCHEITFVLLPFQLIYEVYYYR